MNITEYYRNLYSKHPNSKQLVKDHWEKEPCDSRYGRTEEDRAQYFNEIDETRYDKNPIVLDTAQFQRATGKTVLEVGLGSGSDFIRWARNGAILYGIDLTEVSVKLCLERLQLEGLSANVGIGDVEKLKFDDNYFDIVYSWGVIHHTPNTEKAISEIYRVLKPGGEALIMIYNARALGFIYEWILFALLKKFQPWKSIREIVFYHNESFGTKIYTVKEAKNLFRMFPKVKIGTAIGPGDVLDFQLSDKYKNDRLVRSTQNIFGFLKYLKPYIPHQLGSILIIKAIK